MIRPAALLLLLLTAGTHAETFEAVVTHVIDGDSIRVRVGRDVPLQVRLRDIDAPEICQSRGREARDALAALVLRRRVTIEPSTHDEFQRLIARVSVEGNDVAAVMVAAGWAWSPEWQRRRGPYAPLQTQARAAGRGVWQDESPEAPRDFRRRAGRCR